VAKAMRPFTQGMRLLARQRTAAEQTAKALAALPKHTQRELTVVTVRCPGGKLLLRVVRIPAHLPGAAHGRYLVVPGSATRWRLDEQQITARAWFLADHDGTFGVRCRCHPEVTLTAAQLLGGSAPPPGVSVLASRASTRPVGSPAPLGVRHRAPHSRGVPMPTGPVLSPTGRTLKARRAGYTRHRGPDAPETIEAERDYRAEVLAEHVRRVVDSFPPLSAEQRDKIAALLRAPASDREASVA